jgi:hypothetical protein
MRNVNSNLSHERLQEVLHYNHDTGEFRWKVYRNGRVKAGAVAGRVAGGGYWQIGIDKTFYYAHRLAWFYTTGAWPEKYIDHCNRVKSDNRICNLREVTASENGQNSLFSCGTSKYRGVTWNASHNKWQVTIKLNKKARHLGYFETEEAAAKAYQAAQRKLHPFAPIENPYE